MDKPLFYVTEINPKTILSKEESFHAVKVLRLISGDSIQLTDGKGNLAIGKIDKADIKGTTSSIVEVMSKPLPEYGLTLAVAPTKSTDRLEWMVEKAVEIGIKSIIFTQTDHSERKHLKLDRLKLKAIQAMKQSQRLFLPDLQEPIPLTEVLKKYEEKSCLVAYKSEKSGTMDQLIDKKKSVTIFIGPEGDFSSVEVNMFREKGIPSINLGNARLRTETAALYSCLEYNIINR